MSTTQKTETETLPTISSNVGNNPTAVILEAMERFHTVTPFEVPETETHKKTQGFVVPKGMAVHLLPAEQKKKLTRSGIAMLQTLASFVTFANRFKNPDSVIFADGSVITSPSLEVVIDYHRKGADTQARGELEHRGKYSFPVSAEWIAWSKLNGAPPMSQEQLANFIEDRLKDVIDPDSAHETIKKHAADLGFDMASPSRLLSTSKKMHSRLESEITSVVRPSTGEVTFMYSEKHTDEAGQPLTVPQGFVISIPIFQGGARYQLPVRLRYRMHQQKPIWSLIVDRTLESFQDAFTEAAAQAGRETELPVLFGKDEDS